MNDVSGKDIDISTSTDCSKSSLKNASEVVGPSTLPSSQQLPPNGTITKLSIDSIKISPEYKQIAPEMSQKEFQALKESIKQHGLYFPIIVNNDYFLLDGHHRYRACQELGIKELGILVESFNDNLYEKLFICESAGKRRNLNEWSKIELALKTEKLLKDIANQNRLANLKQNQIKKHQSPCRSNELIGDVAKAAAKSAGLSPATYKRARRILP